MIRVMQPKTHYRTGEVARLLGVAPRTVCLWFDAGKLGGYRLPPANGDRRHGGPRRVERDALVRFLRASGMPLLGPLAGEPAAVLLVGLAPQLAGLLAEALPAHCRAEPYESLFLAGVAAGRQPPAAAVVDLAVGRGEAVTLARWLAGAGGAPAPLFALAGEDELDAPGLTAAGFTEVWRKPFDPALLAERLRKLLAGGAP